MGGVRLKFPGAQALLKGQLLVHSLIDGICLVPVGDDGLISQHPHRGVDDQAGILHLGRVEGLGADSVSVLHKHPVAAVLASSHNKISSHRGLSVCGTSDDNSSSGVGVILQILFQR